MKSICTACNKEFDFTPKTETVKGVDVVFAECDCGKRYFSYVADQEVRERLDRTQRVAKLDQQKFVDKTRQIMRQKKDQYKSIIDEVIG